jgi:tRNA (guanine-N7-)-methyltransferase
VPAGETQSLRRRHDFSPLLEPASDIARLDLEKIFGRSARLQVDLGCGDGTFLCALAQSAPEKNFLGIERLIGRVQKACRKIVKIEIGAGAGRATKTGKLARVDERGGESINVRVLHSEISYAVRFLLPEGSVEVFYLLFPDPWPKRRHQRRRIVTADFLQAIHRALAPEGLLRIATDQVDYFRQIEQLATDPAKERTLKLACLKRANSYAFNIVDCDEVDPFGSGSGQVLPVTKFERKFRQAGAPIYRLTLRKVSPVM